MLKKAEIPTTVYTIKVWLTAVLTTPAIYIGSLIYNDPKHDLSNLLGYCSFVAAELISSGPTWLAFYVITRLLSKYILHTVSLKCILAIIAVGLTVITFIGFDWFWDLKLENGIDKWMWGNAVLIVAGIWIFRFPRHAPFPHRRPVSALCSDNNPH